VFQDFKVSELKKHQLDMTIKRFEDLEVWKNARELCKKIRTISDTTSLGKDYSIRDQILRSSGSCMDNIAEGFERDGNKEFINFLYISKGSIGETRSQIHRSFDAGHFDQPAYEDLINDCLNLSAQISNFINYLHKSEIKGLKKKH
jgi:four helix bundle protein